MVGGHYDHWRIETTSFAVRWPESFALVSPPEPRRLSAFDFRGPERSLLYVQGPFMRKRIPSVAAIAAPGQTILRRGLRKDWLRVVRPGAKRPDWLWVELGYDHEGQPWRQLHRFVPLDATRGFIVTAQSPQTQAAPTAKAAEEVATSLSPFKPD